VPIDPDVKAFLDALNASGQFPTIGEPRDLRTRYNAVPVAAMDGIWRIEDIDIPNDVGRLRIRIYSADDNERAPAVLAFHGGGWVVGDLLWMEGQCRQLAVASGCRVISVEYRLAPEARFPSAAEDAYTALVYVAEHAAAHGIDPNKIAAYGQSAGGNLVAALSLMTRDRSGPRLRLQIPVYPVIDADFDRPSYREWGDGPGLTREQMAWYWDSYVDSNDRKNPYVSPLHAETLAGVAPALVITAEADPLQSEGEAYAERLRADGVEVTHHMYPGMHHGFMNLTKLFPKAQQAFDEVALALRTCFATEDAKDAQ
jgi:acetyl esterase